jgi:hypothetical protein
VYWLVLAAELALLAGLLVPLGLSALAVGGRLLRLSPRLLVTERLLLSLYLSGGILYVLAALPLGVFGKPLLLALLALGFLGLLLLPETREGWPTWRDRDASHPSTPLSLSLIVLLGTLGLLLYESFLLGAQALPNSFDGSVQTTFVTLLLHEGHVPYTLAPIAPFGVVYPQGTSVWFGSGSALYGWSPSFAPVAVPALFLALGAPAAYSWGRRLQGRDAGRAWVAGVPFLAVFGLLATWPRFLVAGSYDFVLGVPLFLVLLGLLEELVHAKRIPWRLTLALGVFTGILASLSVVSAELLVPLFVAMAWACHGQDRSGWPGWLAGGALLGALGALFVTPSLWGFARWWGYPGHVLTALAPGYVPLTTATPSSAGVFVGLVDPFLFRPQDVWLSPFPVLKVELAALLAIGFVLIGLRVLRPAPEICRYIQRRAARHLVVGTLVCLAAVAFLVFGAAEPGPASLLSGFSSAAELSILLFLMYTGVASLALAGAFERLGKTEPAPVPRVPTRHRRRPATLARPVRRGRGMGAWILSAALVAGVVASGAAVTVVEAPPYLSTILTDLSNVSAGDLAALEWSAGLPSCSKVLVAPGSAGQFLPAYSHAQLLYPMNPPPQSGPYQRAVANLSYGNVTTPVLSDLSALGVTVVFVTGQTNVLYLPFDPYPMLYSGDFSVLFHQEDAYLFQYGPGAAASGCAP